MMVIIISMLMAGVAAMELQDMIDKKTYENRNVGTRTR